MHQSPFDVCRHVQTGFDTPPWNAYPCASDWRVPSDVLAIGERGFTPAQPVLRGRAPPGAWVERPALVKKPSPWRLLLLWRSSLSARSVQRWGTDDRCSSLYPSRWQLEYNWLQMSNWKGFPAAFRCLSWWWHVINLWVDFRACWPKCGSNFGPARNNHLSHSL